MMMSYVAVSKRQTDAIYTCWSGCDCAAATMRRPCALPSTVRAGGVVVVVAQRHGDSRLVSSRLVVT